MKNLENKWVLITGAASGIGQALAVEFAYHKANVIIADINEEGMKTTASMVESKGAKSVCIRADVSKHEDIRMLARTAIEKAGGVDILVNNAGIAMVSEVQNFTVGEWNKILSINLHAPIFLTHEFLPHMMSRKSGQIVNIASMAGLIGIPGFASYCATKFGLVGYSETIRGELALHGIGVTVVCPGIVRTPIIENSQLKGFSDSLRSPSPSLMITAQKAAQVIVKGVRRNKAKVIPTVKTGRILLAITRIAPDFSEWVKRKIFAGFERTPLPEGSKRQ